MAGRKPTVIAAACMFFVLEKENYAVKKDTQDIIGQQLGVDPRSVRKVVSEV